MYKQILINAKLQIGNRGQETGLTGRRPLRWRRSALDWSGVPYEKKKKEKKKKKKKKKKKEEEERENEEEGGGGGGEKETKK